MSRFWECSAETFSNTFFLMGWKIEEGKQKQTATLSTSFLADCAIAWARLRSSSSVTTSPGGRAHETTEARQIARHQGQGLSFVDACRSVRRGARSGPLSRISRNSCCDQGRSWRLALDHLRWCDRRAGGWIQVRYRRVQHWPLRQPLESLTTVPPVSSWRFEHFGNRHIARPHY